MASRKLSPEELAGATEITTPAQPATRKLSPEELSGATEIAEPSPVGAQASVSPKEEPGAFRRAFDTIKGGLTNLGNVTIDQAKAYGRVLAHPIDSFATPEGRARMAQDFALTNPAKRRETLRGIDDVTLLGKGQKLGEHVDESMHDAFGFERRMAPEQKAADAAAAGAYRTPGHLIALGLQNPAGEIAGVGGKAIAATAERVAPAAAQKVAAIARALGRVPGVKALSAYEAQAPIQAAVAAPSGHRLEAAKDAATDVIGVGGALVGGTVLAAGRNAILNSEGGQKRQYIEQHGEGAKVGPFTPGKGGVYANQLHGLPENAAGIGEASLKGSTGIMNDIEQRHLDKHGYDYRGGRELVQDAEQAARDANQQSQLDVTLAKEQRRAQLKQTKNEALTETAQRAQKLVGDIEGEKRQMVSEPYRVVKEQIDASPEAKKMRDVSHVVAKMQDAAHDLGTDDAARVKLQTQLALLEPRRDPTTGAVMLSERELNDFRGKLMRTAKVGQSDVRGKAESPLREAAHAAKEMVDQGPYADLNRNFAEGSSEVEAKRQGIGLKRKPGRDRAVEVENVAKRLRKGITDPTQIPNPSVAPEADVAAIRQKIAEAEGSAQPAIEEARLRNAAARSKVKGTKARVAAGDEAAIPDRRMLGLNAKIGTRETDLNQLALRLRRESANSETAGASQADLEAYAAAHPDQATNTRLADLMRNRLDLKYTLDAGAGHRTLGHLMTPRGIIGTLRANATPLAGRVAYGPAKALDPIAVARALGAVRGSTLGEKVKKAIEADKELHR